MIGFSRYGLLLLLTLLASSCSHIVDAPTRTAPIIKVMHEGKVDEVPLEHYVARVLAGEVHPSWPLDALKAQAIASRTFALRRMRERRNNTFHVQNSVMDQVLKSHTSDIFVRAVKESAGLVLTQNSELAETSFHSTCGGTTTDAKGVWGRSYPYLRGSRCGFCTNSPTYSWSVDLPLSELSRKFSEEITTVKILSRTADGRVDAIQLNGGKKISGHEFRMALGPMKIKSTLLTDIVVHGKSLTVKGHGFGHGVGMCQYGALGMARSGKSYHDILAHYYPGTSLKRLY